MYKRNFKGEGEPKERDLLSNPMTTEHAQWVQSADTAVGNGMENWVRRRKTGTEYPG